MNKALQPNKKCPLSCSLFPRTLIGGPAQVSLVTEALLRHKALLHHEALRHREALLRHEALLRRGALLHREALSGHHEDVTFNYDSVSLKQQKLRRVFKESDSSSARLLLLLASLSALI